MIADRFPGVSPFEVDDWPEQMVEDALMRIQIEAAEQARRQKRANRGG